jgi:hypothetical protein
MSFLSFKRVKIYTSCLKMGGGKLKRNWLIFDEPIIFLEKEKDESQK